VTTWHRRKYAWSPRKTTQDTVDAAECDLPIQNFGVFISYET